MAKTSTRFPPTEAAVEARSGREAATCALSATSGGAAAAAPASSRARARPGPGPEPEPKKRNIPVTSEHVGLVRPHAEEELQGHTVRGVLSVGQEEVIGQADQ